MHTSHMNILIVLLTINLSNAPEALLLLRRITLCSYLGVINNIKQQIPRKEISALFYDLNHANIIMMDSLIQFC